MTPPHDDLRALAARIASGVVDSVRPSRLFVGTLDVLVSEADVHALATRLTAMLDELRDAQRENERLRAAVNAVSDERLRASLDTMSPMNQGDDGGCGCEYDGWGTRLRACVLHPPTPDPARRATAGDDREGRG